MTPERLRAAVRVERRKLRAQLPPRLLAVVCVIGPFVFAALLRTQSSSPADALFGTSTHASGFAVALVVLSFAGNWGFPILAGVIAGDLFSGEDRQHTWKTILTRSRAVGEVFLAKTLAAAELALALGATLAAAAIVAGLALVGWHGMIDLTGRVLSPGHLLWLTALAWLICLLPLLAYTSLAILLSIWSRNGIIGVLGPVLVGLLTLLLDLVGRGVWVHLLLIGAGFDTWHGLFAGHVFLGPLLVSLAADVLWIAGCLAGARAILVRREFVEGDVPRRSLRRPALLAAGTVALVAALALATGLGSPGVTARRLDRSVAGSFTRLTDLQQTLLGHAIPAGSQYRILPVCSDRGRRSGPGDWSCTMNVYVVLPGSTHPLTDTPVAYDVSVQSNGCWKAASPPALVGSNEIRGPGGHAVLNPLVTIYGCLDVL